VKLDIQPMSQREALVVAAWHYEPPYSFYDWTADADDLAELLGKETREGKYFSAIGADGELVGWFAFSCEGDCVEFGLGLRPDLTGRGLGLAYLEAGLAFAGQRFTPRRFRLSVAAFNERAIRVYERAGFTPLRTFDHATNGGIHRFLEMTRPAWDKD
jgi:[ribosomal protein S18]-alanine N-acetyltransferase